MNKVGDIVEARFSPDIYKPGVVCIADRNGWCGYCGADIDKGDKIVIVDNHVFCLEECR